MSIILLLFLLPVFTSSLSNFPIVHTSYGDVRGYEYRSASGFVGEIFKKIPYASPPTGARRWKKPVPPEPWNYTADGTFFGPACAQVPSAWAGIGTGFSEDCLLLNVYSSRECREAGYSCPVVLYIHGGSALYSGPHMFPDEALVEKYARQGVIMITCTYRLGVFGVMALGDENVLPANLAMHDIVEALRFVRQEVHAFGGDKDQVTLMGHSTGSTIVLALLFSPAVNRVGETPLFARAIGMSSSAIFENEESQVNRSHVVAKHLGCTGTARETIDCLQLFNTSEIINAADEIGGRDSFSTTQLSGIVAAGELMPISNMNELRNSKQERMAALTVQTKLMIGTIANEFRPAEGYTTEQLQKLDTDFSQVTRVLGVLNPEECTKKYFDDIESGKFDPRYDILSQAMFMTTALFGRAQAAAGAEVYLYQLDYSKHVQHADDLYYVMGVHDHPMDENEKWLSRVYPLYFTNFIKGLPLAPDWTPLSPDLLNYYSINKSLTEGVVPSMKLGYQQYLMNYFEGMVKFDEQLASMRKTLLNTPVEYKNLTFYQSGEPFNLRDLLFYGAALAVFLFFMFKLYVYLRDRLQRADEERARLISRE